jgi:hypothetical protein
LKVKIVKKRDGGAVLHLTAEETQALKALFAPQPPKKPVTRRRRAKP